VNIKCQKFAVTGGKNVAEVATATCSYGFLVFILSNLIIVMTTRLTHVDIFYCMAFVNDQLQLQAAYIQRSLTVD